MKRTAKRLLSGCVGIGMLASLVHDILAGAVSIHGVHLRSISHPVYFGLYGLFVAVVGLAALYGAAVGYHQDEKPVR
ncbi:hypothetical protein U1872_18355 [Sphingomonas sp. RB3P16]|uniref:hypothetical protein n=1 Tax=Parasphingomonas frigoris TaxID=3096163 RepID=UPI002FCC52DB